MNKEQIKTLIFILIVLVSGIIIYYVKENKSTDDSVNDSAVVISPEKINMTVKGAVEKPGIYKVEKNSKMSELIKKTGLKENAYVTEEFLDYIITSSDTVIIPVKIDYNNYSGTGKMLTNKDVGNISKFTNRKKNIKKEDNGLININTAGIDKLKTLPRIGDKTAKKIIKYREKQKFKNKKELMNIPGIGEKTFSRLADKISVK